MATTLSNLEPIKVMAGVQSVYERSNLSTPHWTAADKIRFWEGVPRKIGGWRSFAFEDNAAISGLTRSFYSAVISNQLRSVIGTHQKLYSLSGQNLANITPLQTTTIAIANSLATDYGALGANPFASTNGLTTVVVTDANASKYAVGDVITFSGSAGFASIPAGELDGAHIIYGIGVGSYTIRVTTAATATTTGGGAGVTRATGRLTVTAAAHGQLDGDRVKIAGAANTGGVLAGEINGEFILRNAAANTFDIFTSSTATSSVAAGGGAATTYQKEIADGLVDEGYGQGYGVGRYGVGLYGTSRTSTAGRAYPRIWFIDRFADNFLATAGNQTGVYTWDGSLAAAPVLLSGAPTAVNYVFESDSIVVTFGAGDIPNRVFASDQGDPTQWTSSSENKVFDDNIEGAGRLMSHAPVDGGNLIFTEFQTYTMRFIGGNEVWDIKQKEKSIGLIAPMARVSINGAAYWMGQKNFYRYLGGNVEIIPSNSSKQCTMLNYVFKNLNTSQKSKIFAWHNEEFNEIWWHYPSAGSNECDRVIRLSLSDFSWVPDTFDRTCSEYPFNLYNNPRLINSAGTLYVHEDGTDADGAAMPWSLSSPLHLYGRDNGYISAIVPDSVQVGTVALQIIGLQYPQSPVQSYNATYQIASNTDIQPVDIQGRFWKYTLSGNEIGQSWIAGQWFAMVQGSSKN